MESVPFLVKQEYEHCIQVNANNFHLWFKFLDISIVWAWNIPRINSVNVFDLQWGEIICKPFVGEMTVWSLQAKISNSRTVPS